ncbi:putative ribonuclease H-like domain-containing protein [Tanacetum coccineum]|uniref:Ribonuclease H-like domain-containing protein n=1 Tax=Tanacetum coccineum TaxID=301880 RepID=A0ABQ4XKI0_9ASTR
MLQEAEGIKKVSWLLILLDSRRKSSRFEDNNEGSDITGWDMDSQDITEILGIRSALNMKSLIFRDYCFFYGKIEEEVYVCQPLGFEDSDFPDRVYKVEKPLYGLHQAPRAWYETLSIYLLDNGFQRGKIDKTLFIKRHKGDILLVQVYMDDIIFGSTKKELCIAFEKFTEAKTASTPIETQKPLLKDEDGKEVDVQMYRSMISSLMYPASSRPDIMFAVYACARYQVNPKVSHLYAVKRFLAYTDSDYAGASLDKKSTTRGCQFLGCRLISWQCKKQTVVVNSTTEAEYVAASSCRRQDKQREKAVFCRFLTTLEKKLSCRHQGKGPRLYTAVEAESKGLVERKLKKGHQVPQPSDPIKNVADEVVHKELGDSLVRAATTASSLEAEQDIGNIIKTQSKETPNESSSQGTNSSGGPWCQKTMGDTIAQTRFESVSKYSNDSLLVRGNTLRSDDDRLKLDELMALCTTLQNRVLVLEKRKTTQHNEIASLKKGSRSLKKNKLRTHWLKRLYKVGLTARVGSYDNEESLGEDASKQGRIDAIDADEEITLLLEEMNNTKLKKKWIVIQEHGESTTIISSQQSQDKGKGILIEPVKPMNKKDLIRRDEETALNLQLYLIENKDFAREAFKRVNTFEDFRTELVEGKEKRAGTELVQEITKKQKVEDDKETAELKQLMKIIPDEEEVAIDAIPLAVKSPSIVG